MPSISKGPADAKTPFGGRVDPLLWPLLRSNESSIAGHRLGLFRAFRRTRRAAGRSPRRRHDRSVGALHDQGHRRGGPVVLDDGRDYLYGNRGNDRIYARDSQQDHVYGGRGYDYARVDIPLDLLNTVASH